MLWVARHLPGVRFAVVFRLLRGLQTWLFTLWVAWIASHGRAFMAIVIAKTKRDEDEGLWCGIVHDHWTTL